MKEENRKEELQSRREFFKSAAKAALPVIGALVLSQMPSIAEASPADCQYQCSVGCGTGCSGRCEGTCTDACARTCRTYCNSTCDIKCYRSAY